MRLVTKTMLILLFAIFVFAGFLGVTNDRDIKIALHERDLNWSTTLTAILAESIAKDTIDGNELSASRTLNNIIKANKELEYAYIVDFDGNYFVHTFTEGFPKRIVEHNHNNNQEDTIYHFNGKEILDIKNAILNGMDAYVHLGINTQTSNDSIDALIKNMMINLAVVAIIATCFIYFTLTKVTRPLARLSGILSEYNGDNKKLSIDIDNSSEEIMVLTQSINKMLAHRDLLESDRKESEQRLKDAEEIAHLGNWEWDIKSGNLHWSDEIYRIFGLNKDKTAASYDAFIMAIHPADQTLVQDAITQSLQTLSPYEIEHRIVKPSDEILFVLEKGIVIVDEEGKAKRMIGTVLDITARKQSEKVKNEFIATISHELRTPLTSIIGTLKLVREGVAGEIQDRSKDLLDVALNNSRRLNLLINDILDMEKIESGKMEYHFDDKPLMPIIMDAISNNENYNKDKGIVINLDNDIDENLLVYCDEDRLSQVFNNILSNAIKFSPENGTIKVHSCLVDEMVRVSFIDEGPGIPVDQRKKVFEKFVQIDSSDNRNPGGTGLGLSISRSIIKNHQGVIDFISESGHGTEFYIELPLNKTH